LTHNLGTRHHDSIHDQPPGDDTQRRNVYSASCFRFALNPRDPGENARRRVRDERVTHGNRRGAGRGRERQGRRISILRNCYRINQLALALFFIAVLGGQRQHWPPLVVTSIILDTIVSTSSRRAYRCWTQGLSITRTFGSPFLARWDFVISLCLGGTFGQPVSRSDNRWRVGGGRVRGDGDDDEALTHRRRVQQHRWHRQSPRPRPRASRQWLTKRTSGRMRTSSRTHIHMPRHTTSARAHPRRRRAACHSGSRATIRPPTAYTPRTAFTRHHRRRPCCPLPHTRTHQTSGRARRTATRSRP
jgi:hypothetical protein